MRRFIEYFSSLLALGIALQAHGATDTACWNRDLERTDFLVNPPENGDNNFFTSISNQNQNTNVVLLYPARESMKGFTQKLYRIRVDLGGSSPTGCTNQYLNGLRYFMPATAPAPAGSSALQGPYSAAKVYPDPGPTYSGGGGQSDGLTVGRAYRFRNWPANGGGTAETAATACTNAASTAARVAECTTCLASNGYWLNPDVADNDTSTKAAVFSTNYLRFHPVKWSLLSLAYKRLINGPLLSVLREGVVAMNGTQGGAVVQKMLPQSCNGVGRPLNQKQGAIDGLSYTSTANPLAELLFNAGWYMGGQESPWVFSNSATEGGSPMAVGRSGPCNGCNGDFIVLFSDGRSDSANPACNATADGGLPPQCTAVAQCSTLGMGPEDDGNDFLDPSLVGGAGTLISGSTVRQTPGGTCDMDLADDVARWMRANNMSSSTPSRVSTFVVGVGDPNNTYGDMTTLGEIAAAGGGEFVVADDFSDLETKIEYVLTSIISRATSFSAAAITAVQTRGFTSAFVPRFRPTTLSTWEGSLSRYDLYNEFAAGCSKVDYGVKNALNPNGDGTCTDIYLRDSNHDFVGENSDGVFVQLDTTAAYDAGWPIKVSGTGTEYPAVPFWEASARLTAREQAILSGSSSATPRRIYTVAPNSTGGYLTTLVPFTVANVANVTPLLKLGGLTGDFCTTLAGRTRHSYVTEDDCAADVIRFMHGEDVLRQNPANRTSPAPATPAPRLNILGDIFHSTPVLVTPPAPTMLCDLGLANNCVPSLYAPTLTPGGAAAYASFQSSNQYRDQYVLVGANDGMLHAFSAGNDQVSGSGVHSYDLGTGDESWAFIPPDMMPKLIRYMLGERHELLVDGTPMVRDVWVDGSGATSADRVKQADEYHTMVVIGEREGGRHYVALDITSITNPSFKWSWPQPGTNTSLFAGESWSDLGPAAAPIGPIAEYDASGPITVRGQQARERYVLTIGGGYDPAFVRGRSIHVIDMWSGAEVYRFSRQDSTGATDLRNKLFPVVAPVSMVDVDSDGLFDTAVVGDTGGQVWTLGLGMPGRDTDSDGRYDNWYGARSFIQFNGAPFYKRSPFFQRANIAILPGNIIRVMLGAGDRAGLKESGGGTCGIANLSACIRKNCSVTTQQSRYAIGDSSTGHSVTASWTAAAGANEPTSSFTIDTNAQGTACTDVVDAQIDYSFDCGGTTASYSSVAMCDWGASSGIECPVSDGRPLHTEIAYTPAITMEYSRFYSFRLFDSASRVPFFDATEAATYDANALTETSLIDASAATSSTTGNGWWLKHAFSRDEKTASAGLLLGGCVIWNTLVPSTTVASTCGNVIPLDTAYTYQGDAITGAIACGTAGSSSSLATTRARTRMTYVAPQQPSTVISLNPTTGEIMYSGASIEPGTVPLGVQVGVSQMWGDIHWLEVPRKLHECRHTGVNCK